MEIENNIQQIQNKCPWIALLSEEIHWRQVQQKVECAALFTNRCSSAGWFVGSTNLMDDIMEKLIDINDNLNYDSQAQDLQSLVDEFIQNVLPDNNSFYKSVQENVIQQINEFLQSRGGFKRSNQDILKIINHNLSIIRTKFTRDSLPDINNISLELLYGIMISYYGVEIYNFCPQLAIISVSVPFANGNAQLGVNEIVQKEPLVRKRVSLMDKYKKMKNWEKINLNENMSYEEIVQTLQMAKTNKVVGKATQNKLKKLIKYMHDPEFKRSWITKDNKFKVRKDIKQLHLSLDDEVDYRQSVIMEEVFFQALSQCLNRLPTDICIKNSGTLRNPTLHLVYPYLTFKYPQLKQINQDQIFSQVQKLKYIACLIKRAKKYDYYTSDWQNNIARQWTIVRSSIISYVRKQLNSPNDEIKQKIQVSLQIPPPVQYDIAIDLFPQAHAFAFTYGRRQGYALDENSFQESMQWFKDDDGANFNEKQYFFNLLRHPVQRLEFLQEIPQKITSIQDDKILIDKLDQWLKENIKTQTDEIMKNYVLKRLNKLPQNLQQKVDQNKMIYRSIIVLYNAVFDIYPPEDLYLDGIQLSIPKVKADLPKQKNDEDQVNINKFPEGYGGEIQNKWFYWGPANYGGYIDVNNYNYDYEQEDYNQEEEINEDEQNLMEQDNQ